MSQLNIAYLLAVFQAVATGTSQGSYAIVAAESPEVAALVKAKYIKLSKKLHNEDGNVGAVLVDGATEADLRVDFEIPDYPAEAQEPVAPAEEEIAMTNTNAPVTENTAPVADYSAPQAAENQAAPFALDDLAPASESDTAFQSAQPFAGLVDTVPSAPVTEDQIHQINVETAEQIGAAPVVEQNGSIVIGGSEFEVAAVAQTRKGEVEIDIGVPFVTKVSAAAKKKTGGLEHHPFNDIAALKLQNPNTAPSFHLAGRAVKDMSNAVRRANDRYEAQGSQVTFRANPADETDPKGTGVRVFALFLHEAPAQRRSSKKEVAENGTEAE